MGGGWSMGWLGREMEGGRRGGGDVDMGFWSGLDG